MAYLEPAETAAVAWVLEQRPTEYGDLVRKAGQELSTWLANCAYWYAYPEKPFKIDAKDKAGIDAWLRIEGNIRENLIAEAPPAYNASQPRWPLATPPHKWGSGGSFGARRVAKKSVPQTRYHCGVDLDAALGDPVLATEAATVAAIDVGWENPTKCIILHLDSGNTLLIGGLKLGSMPAVGTRVAQGEQIAVIQAYPKGDTMAHVGLYEGHLSKSQVQQRMAWYVGDASHPKGMLDPSDYLKAAMANTPLSAENAAMASYGDAPNEAIYEGEVAEGIEGGAANEGGDQAGGQNGGQAASGGGIPVAGVVAGGVLALVAGYALTR